MNEFNATRCKVGVGSLFFERGYAAGSYILGVQGLERALIKVGSKGDTIITWIPLLWGPVPVICLQIFETVRACGIMQLTVSYCCRPMIEGNHVGS